MANLLLRMRYMVYRAYGAGNPVTQDLRSITRVIGRFPIMRVNVPSNLN
jgi:hypothetical protein